MKRHSKSSSIRLLKSIYDKLIYVVPAIVLINILLGFKDDYSISMYLESSTPNSTNTAYQSVFNVINDGNSIGKESIYKPIKLILQDGNSFIDARKKNDTKKEHYKLKIINSSTLQVSFDLINKKETFVFTAFTKKPINSYTIKQRIKNIDKVKYYHFEDHPYPTQRISLWWFVLLLFAIISTLDALFLLLKNKSLYKILDLTDALNGQSNKQAYLKQYALVYDDYKVNLKINTKETKAQVNDLITHCDFNNQSDLYQVKERINSITRTSVLYYLRTPYIIVGPILFIIAITGMVYNILSY